MPAGHTLGDPIHRVAVAATDEFMEHLDAATLGDGRALLGANNGWAILDIAEGRFTHVEFATARSVYRLAADPDAGLAWGGTQMRGVMRWDLSTDPPTVLPELRPWSGWHGDVAAAGGRGLVAAGSDGAWLLDGAYGETLARLDDGDAMAVALSDTLAVTSDGTTLRVYSIEDPTNPVLQSTLELTGHTADLALQGTHLAAAAGAAGVHLIDVTDGVLVHRDTWSTSAAAYGVAVDGDRIWGAAWDSVVMGTWGPDGPVRLGEEAAAGYALGVDARAGTAVVADWNLVSVLQPNPDRTGPELRMDTSVALHTGAALPLLAENAGHSLLEVDLVGPDGLALSASSLSLCPGEVAAVVLTPEDDFLGGTIGVQSTDPDEAEATIQLSMNAGGLGTTHPDIVLGAYDPSTDTTGVWSLADHAGELIYIGWFAPS